MLYCTFCTVLESHYFLTLHIIKLYVLCVMPETLIVSTLINSGVFASTLLRAAVVIPFLSIRLMWAYISIVDFSPFSSKNLIIFALILLYFIYFTPAYLQRYFLYHLLIFRLLQVFHREFSSTLLIV